MNVNCWRVLSVAGWLVVAVLVVGTVVSRRQELAVIGHRGQRFGVEARLRDGRLWLGWRPRSPYRPRWAGQVNRMGFRCTRWSDGSGQVGVPAWVAVVVFTAAAASAEGMNRRRRRRRGPGRCRACGYDLRATPERCPECGALAGVASPGTPGEG